MPGDRAYSFILTIEGGQARGDAERWAKQVESLLADISFEIPGFKIEGLETAQKQLQEITKLAGRVGKSLFRDAASEAAKVDANLAKLQEGLTGILRVPERPQWADVLEEQLEELVDVGDRAGRKTANALMLARDRAEKLTAEIAAATAEITRLSQLRVFPQGLGLSDVSLGQYREIAGLIAEQNRLEEQGKQLGKEKAAKLADYTANMERVVYLARQQVVEQGKEESGIDLSKAQTDYQALIGYEQQLNKMQTLRRNQQRIIMDKTMKDELALPAGAKGDLADFAVAMGVLAKHTTDANKAITSQSTRLGTYMKRITALGEHVGTFAKIEEKLARVFKGQAATPGLQKMAGETSSDAKQVESVITRMVSSVKMQLKRLKGDQEGAFDKVVEEAKEADDKVVRHSYIKAMVNGVLYWIDRMEQGEEGAFLPLIRGSQQAAEAVERSFQRMRMPPGAPGAGRYASRQQLEDYWRSAGVMVDSDAVARQAEEAVRMRTGAVSPYDEGAIAEFVKEHHEAFDRELNEYNRSINMASKLASEKDRALRRMGVTDKEWAGMGMAEKIGRSLNAAEYQWMGLQRIGNSLTSTGMKMKVAAAAAAGGMALLAKSYIDLDEPLGRAARNLELNTEQYEYLKTAIIGAAGTTSYFKPEEQAEGLYLWAAATGEVVENTDELDEVLERTSHVQRLAKLAQVDYGTAVEFVTDIQSQFQLSVDDTEDIVAKLVKVAAVSKAEVMDLGQAFVYTGAKAEQVNMSFDETAALLNVLSGFGQRGTRAGRGMSMLIENLIAPSEKAAALMEEKLGKGAMEANGEFIGLGNAVDLLAEKLGNLTPYQRAEFMAQITTANATRVLTPLVELQIKARERGVNVIRAEQKLLQGGAAAMDAEVQAYRALREEIYGYEVAMTSAMDTYQQQWAQFETSDRGRFEKMEARWKGALTNLGRTISDVALGPLTELAEKAAEFIDTIAKNETLVKVAMGGVGVIAAVGALTAALGKGLTMYADYKVVTAAATMMAASENMLLAAGIQAGKEGAKGVGLALGKGAAAAVGAYYVADLATQGISGGKDLYDFWSIKEERWQAAFEAEARAADMRRKDVVDQITELEKEADWLESYGDWGTLLAGFVNKEWEEIPEEYKGLFGMPSAQLMRERYAEIEEEMKVLQNRLQEFQDEQGYGYTPVPGAENLPPMLKQANDQLEAMGWNLEDSAGAMSHLTTGTQGLLTTSIELANTWLGMGRRISNTKSLVASLTGAMHDMVDPADIAEEAGRQAGAGWQRITGLAGLMSPAQLRAIGDQYTQELWGIYSRADDMQQWQLDLELARAEANLQAKLDGLKEYYSEEEKLQDDSLEKQKQAYQSYRSLISGMFTETPVTALQMAQSEAGAYDDQWDEAARRMRAALEGSADWQEMIPSSIREQGDTAVQEWGKQWLKNFYAGMMPDAVNWDAFAADFAQKIAEQNGKSNLVDRAIQELAARGITADRPDVMKALGLESPMQTMFFGGLTPEEAGTELQGSVTTALGQVAFDDEEAWATPSKSMLAGLTTGMETAAAGVTWTNIITTAWNTQLDKDTTPLESLGKRLAGPLYDGFLTGLGEMPFVESIVGVVLDKLNEALE